MRLPANYELLSSSERRVAREQYVRAQGGRCYWCQNPLNAHPASHMKMKPIKRELFPPGFFKTPVHLQHSHRTGMTEGAVHAHCNAVMWQHYGR